MEEYIIKQNKYKIVTNFLVLLIFAIFFSILTAIYVVIKFNFIMKLLLVIICSMLSIIFFAVSIFTLNIIVKNKPLVVITDEYIENNSTMFSIRKIKIEDIQKALLFKSADNIYVSIYLKDPNKYLEKQSFIKRTLIKLYQKENMGQVNLSLKLSDKSPMEVLDTINKII